MVWWITAIALVAVVGFLWLQPAGFRVERRHRVPAPPETVFALVQDLRAWPQWSPWLLHEPDAELDYSDDTCAAGAWYSWQGKLMGAGRVTHVSVTPSQSITQQIVFLKPMSSSSEIDWSFRAVEGGTEVVWCMRGRMPFLMRPLNRLMDGWIGRDFELGLAMLARSASPAAPQFEIHFEGETRLPARQCVSRPFKGKLADLPQIYAEGLPALHDAIEQADLDISGPPLGVYHKIKPRSGDVEGEIAIPVRVSQAIDGFRELSLPAQRYYRTRLQGDYSHLKQAWYAAYSHVRMVKLKASRRHPVVEVYANRPDVNPGLALTTYLDIPLK